MNASLPVALLLALLASTWLLGRRRPRPFLRSTDTSDVAALNRAQIALVRAQEATLDPAAVMAPDISVPPGSDVPHGAAVEPMSCLPRDLRQRRAFLRQLQAWQRGTPEQRLRAITIARHCQHRCVLPLLRFGLRDPDPAVMAQAAAGIERFRGRPCLPDPVEGRDPIGPIGPGRLQTGKAVGAPRPLSVLRTR